MPETLTIAPANEAKWDDLHAIFGDRGVAAGCQCQWFKQPRGEYRATPREVKAQRFREQTRCGTPDSPVTTGLVAWLDGEPAGWVAVEPRTGYMSLRASIWKGRDEDRDDPTVWAVTCFVVRVGYRRRGLMHALAAAAVGYARDRGARAIEGYPMITEPGREIPWGDLYVGSVEAFEAAGFATVAQSSPQRFVMRIDF